MRHRATERFWRLLKDLPYPTQALARQNYEMLKNDIHHPSLHFKKVGRLWSVRVGLKYRALALLDGTDFIWIWIGSHGEYDKLVKR